MKKSTLIAIALMIALSGFAQNNLHSDSLGGYTGNAITLTGNPYTGLVYINSPQTPKTDTPLTDTVKTILLVIDTTHYTTVASVPYYITGVYWDTK